MLFLILLLSHSLKCLSFEAAVEALASRPLPICDSESRPPLSGAEMRIEVLMAFEAEMPMGFSLDRPGSLAKVILTSGGGGEVVGGIDWPTLLKKTASIFGTPNGVFELNPGAAEDLNKAFMSYMASFDNPDRSLVNKFLTMLENQIVDHQARVNAHFSAERTAKYNLAVANFYRKTKMQLAQLIDNFFMKKKKRSALGEGAFLYTISLVRRMKACGVEGTLEKYGPGIKVIKELFIVMKTTQVPNALSLLEDFVAQLGEWGPSKNLLALAKETFEVPVVRSSSRGNLEVQTDSPLPKTRKFSKAKVLEKAEGAGVIGYGAVISGIASKLGTIEEDAIEADID